MLNKLEFIDESLGRIFESGDLNVYNENNDIDYGTLFTLSVATNNIKDKIAGIHPGLTQQQADKEVLSLLLEEYYMAHLAGESQEDIQAMSFPQIVEKLKDCIVHTKERCLALIEEQKPKKIKLSIIKGGLYNQPKQKDITQEIANYLNS